jgi:hypothetical protein
LFVTSYGANWKSGKDLTESPMQDIGHRPAPSPAAGRLEAFILATEEQCLEFDKVALRRFPPEMDKKAALRTAFPEVDQALEKAQVSDFDVRIGAPLDDYDEEQISEVPSGSFIRLTFRSRADLNRFKLAYGPNAQR